MTNILDCLQRTKIPHEYSLSVNMGTEKENRLYFVPCYSNLHKLTDKDLKLRNILHTMLFILLEIRRKFSFFSAPKTNQPQPDTRTFVVIYEEKLRRSQSTKRPNQYQ